MAVKVHFVGGGSIMLDGETLKGFRDAFDGAGSLLEYPNSKALIVRAHVTHVEEVEEDDPIETFAH